MLKNDPDVLTVPEASRPKPGCQACRNGVELQFPFTFAFQPIVDVGTRKVFAYEALVRGPEGEPAGSILARVNASNRYQFDQACRGKAVELAAKLGMKERLSINFLPNAVYQPAACIQSTLHACRVHRFPTSQIIFEVTEGEEIGDRQHLLDIFRSYRDFGFLTAIDDFGAGYSGLGLLSEYQPHVIKIDMALVRNIDLDLPKQAIVTGVLTMARMLGSRIVAEGIETTGERDWLRRAGVELMQGYLFGRPALEQLAPVPASAWK